MHHARNGFLTAYGLAETAQREAIFREGVDRDPGLRYLDNRVSVSGLELERDPYELDDHQLDEQYRRFHNGS